MRLSHFLSKKSPIRHCRDYRHHHRWGLFNLFLLTGMVFHIENLLHVSGDGFTYFGNKHWSFNRSTAVTPVKSSAAANSRQFVLFIIVNLIALSFSLIALYVEHGKFSTFANSSADNIAADVIGLGRDSIPFLGIPHFRVSPSRDETPQEETVRERRLFPKRANRRRAPTNFRCATSSFRRLLHPKPGDW